MDEPSDNTPNSSRVHVFGQSLSIRGTASQEYMQVLATYVTGHMEQLSKEAPLTPLAQVAMLACMNISHELFTMRSEHEAQENHREDRTRELLDNLDAAFHSGKDSD